MESGLEDRNNDRHPMQPHGRASVSMESGLEDRNNREDDIWSEWRQDQSQWSPA